MDSALCLFPLQTEALLKRNVDRKLMIIGHLTEIVNQILPLLMA